MVGGNSGGGWVNTAKIKVVPLQLVPCGVHVCVWVYLCLRRFSGEAQQVLTGPPSSLHSPCKPFFFLYVCVHVVDRVCASRLDLLSVGLMLKWLTAKQSQGRLRAVVGRKGPYSLTAFGPEGERETNTERDGRENPNRLIIYTEMEFEWKSVRQLQSILRVSACCCLNNKW